MGAKPTDPQAGNIRKVFLEAVKILDESENEVRCRIEAELLDVAGINRMPVSQAMLARDKLAKMIADIREPYIRKCFQYLRENLPGDLAEEIADR